MGRGEGDGGRKQTTWSGHCPQAQLPTGERQNRLHGQRSSWYKDAAPKAGSAGGWALRVGDRARACGDEGGVQARQASGALLPLLVDHAPHLHVVPTARMSWATQHPVCTGWSRMAQAVASLPLPLLAYPDGNPLTPSPASPHTNHSTPTHLRQRAADGVNVRAQPVAQQLHGGGHALQHTDLQDAPGERQGLGFPAKRGTEAWSCSHA